MLKCYKPFIQVAGIKSKEEASMLIKAGFNSLGFPFRLNFHKEDTSEEVAKEIISELPKNILPVLITYLTSPKDLKELCRYLEVKAVQIHSHIETVQLAKIREYLQDILIFKSLVFKKDNFNEILTQQNEYEPYVDAFLTDTFDENTGAEGATGLTHNWDFTREIVAISKKPVILAGGLNPSNVASAIKYVKPFGVDVHTGIEDKSGNKDVSLSKQFIDNILKAYKE